MSNNGVPFEELAAGAAKLLETNRSRASGTVHHYQCLWRKVERYLKANSLDYFTETAARDYLLQKFGDCDYEKLPKGDKDLIRAVELLCELYRSGTIRPVKEQTVFEGKMGQLMLGYLSDQRSLRLKKSTISEKERHLYRFLRFLQNKGVGEPRDVTQPLILTYLKEMSCQFSTLTHHTLATLRNFLLHLYNQGLTTQNLSTFIPRDNFKKQAKLPSTYSREEIERMLAGTDRGNATGKRNYAILLLAARLGLRASDISGLKFESLLWDRSSLVLHQQKTGKKLELPLLGDVGNAIIDYLKNGRPKSNEPFVFLLARTPFTPMINSSITGIVHTAIVKAGISIQNRKHGAHALRHSLAGILLERRTILPVISEVLGHSTTESTRFYLRIDLKSLWDCALAVPPVDGSFNTQKGEKTLLEVFK